KAKNVLVFKDNGEFERQVGARGQGPGEYIQANDFSIDSQGNVYVYDGPKKQLLLYNTENICIKSLQLPFDIHNFTVLPNGKFLFWLAQYNKGKSKGYQVALTDSLLNVEKEYIPYTQYFDANMVMGSYFQQTDNKFIYYHGISDSAYIFTQDGDLEGNIYIDFGDNKAPEKFRDNLMEIIKNQEYQYLSYSPFIIKNYIMGCIIDKKDVISFVYDTKNKTMYKNSEFKFGEINSPKSYVNDSTFISVFNEAYLPPDFMSDSILTDEQKKHIYEDGGTIICKYTLLQ
ncbi:MAG: 6-bladed beta-propeller, partial [Prevotellaceae bacterium]|nr:6-bladed beta-propeller [Prevotellaceae bacterium]